MKSVDQWQHVQSDNLPRFTIQGTERREVQTKGFGFKPGSKQITGGQ